MVASRDRRSFIARGLAGVTALVASQSLRAVSNPLTSDLDKLLGMKLPGPLLSLLPGEVFEGASFIRKLLALEAEAKALSLPKSLLSRGEGSIQFDPDRLYELALPRLVALIDRSEFRKLGFAERTGELLALLHRTQHVTAEGYALAPVSEASGLAAPMFFNDQPAMARIKLPSEAVPEPLPVPNPTALQGPITVSRTLQFDALSDEYASLFRAAQIRPQHRETAEWHLTMLRESKARYSGVAERTGVPWYFVATVHGLEASFNFRAHLHNGDFPLQRRTRQVPAGRPTRWLPPSDWESSAIDALRIMGFAGADDWSVPRILHRLEAFNGFGYRRMGRTSPYLWSFTTAYDRGKYVADGKFSASAISQQCGGAVMLKLLAEAGDIAFA